MVLERGEGARVWDVDGKEYLDFTSGWAVNNVGHCNEVVADAIAEQARTLLQTSNQFYSIPQLKMAEILVENSCLDKIFICNSGAEANEGAIKLAKKYGKKNKRSEEHTSELQSLVNLVCRLLLEKKNKKTKQKTKKKKQRNR